MTRDQFIALMAEMQARFGDEACWEWPFGLSSGGYGKFNLPGEKSKTAAHRFAYELMAGSLGERFGCHECDNPKCFNWRHIFPGTAFDNTEDAVKKGRLSTKLKKEDLPAVLADPRPYPEIAKAYRVSVATISLAKRRRLRTSQALDYDGVVVLRSRTRKLTPEQRAAIKLDVRGAGVLSAEYGVSRGVIDYIRKYADQKKWMQKKVS